MAENDLLQIGEVAQGAGVTVRTVRYYEERGLLPPVSRTSGGLRLYCQADVVRLRFIRRLKALGLRLAEIESLLGHKDASEGSRERVTHTLEVLLMEQKRVEEQLEAFTELQKEVAEALASVRVCEKCGADQCPTNCSRRAFLL